MRSGTFAAALVLVLGASAGCTAKADEAAFTQDMLKRFQEAMPGGEIEAKSDEHLVLEVRKTHAWDQAVINLHRIYNYCNHTDTGDCEQTKAEFVRKISKPPVKATSKSLRLIVRDKQYIDYITSQTSKGDDRAIFRQIGEDLFAVLVSDSADAIGSVGSKTLQDLQLTQDQAWALAFDQTKAVVPPIPTARQLETGAVAYQDREYLGSLLVQTAQWQKLAEEVGPELFVTAVSDQFVLVGKFAPGPKLDAFRKTVSDDCAAQERCISPNIYRFRSSQWVIAD